MHFWSKFIDNDNSGFLNINIWFFMCLIHKLAKAFTKASLKIVNYVDFYYIYWNMLVKKGNWCIN